MSYRQTARLHAFPENRAVSFRHEDPHFLLRRERGGGGVQRRQFLDRVPGVEDQAWQGLAELSQTRVR